jgi:Ca2+-binding EF-hand superfamily protein
MNQVDTEEELKIAFRVFDKNDQGDIAADELRKSFNRIKLD